MGGERGDKEERRRQWQEHRDKVRERVTENFHHHQQRLAGRDYGYTTEEAAQLAATLALTEAVEALCDNVEWGLNFIGQMVQD